MGKAFEQELNRHRDELKTRLEALRSTLQLTDRVLTGNSKATLKFVDGDLRGAQCPAMSVGPAITVDLGQIKDVHTKAGLVKVLGLNYHEVGHVRYGIDIQRITSELKQAKHGRFEQAYEVLEEGRIETLLCTRYEKLKKYLTFAVVEFFVDDKTAWDTAFLYTHGRKYLPRTVRDTFRGIFEKQNGKELTSKMAALIEQYRVLSFGELANIQLAARLINRFAELMQEADLPNNEPHKQRHVSGAMNTAAVKKSSDEDAEEAKKQAAEQKQEEKGGKDGSGFKPKQDDSEESEDEEQEEPSEEDGEEEETEDDSEGGTGDASQEGDEEPSDDSEEEDGSSPEEGESDGPGGGEDLQEDDAGDSDGRNVGDSPDADDPDMDFDGGGRDGGDDSDGLPEDGSSSTSSNGAGTGAGRDQDFELDSEDLKEELLGTLSEVLDTEHVQNDVEQLQDAMDDQAGLNSTLDRRALSTDLVTPEMVLRSDRLAMALRELWAQMEPGWEYGLSEGSRIDMNRAAVIQEVADYEHIYVDWSEGQQDNSGLCAVILVDKSGSMGSPAYALDGAYLGSRASVASQNLWEIRKALQEIEATTTVIDFDYYCCTMYDTDETVDPARYARLHASGGTNPMDALKEARRILSMTEMPNKLLVVVTDGEWGYDRYEEVFSPLNDVVKVAILIGGTTFSHSKYFDVTAKTGGDIFEPVAQAVTEITERNMR